MLLFWFSGISCLLFFLFYHLSCNSFFICWKTVKQRDLWNSLLMETLQKLKIYILIIYVQGYLSKEPVGLTTHFCWISAGFQSLTPPGSFHFLIPETSILYIAMIYWQSPSDRNHKDAFRAVVSLELPGISCQISYIPPASSTLFLLLLVLCDFMCFVTYCGLQWNW